MGDMVDCGFSVGRCDAAGCDDHFRAQRIEQSIENMLRLPLSGNALIKVADYDCRNPAGYLEVFVEAIQESQVLSPR